MSKEENGRITEFLKVLDAKRNELIAQALKVTKEHEENVCMCKKCCWVDTGKEFSVYSGGDDFVGQCPNCFAPEEEIEDLIN